MQNGSAQRAGRPIVPTEGLAGLACWLAGWSPVADGILLSAPNPHF